MGVSAECPLLHALTPPTPRLLFPVLQLALVRVLAGWAPPAGMRRILFGYQSESYACQSAGGESDFGRRHKHGRTFRAC